MDGEDFTNGEANAARDRLIRIAQRAHSIEIALVGLAAGVGLVLIVVLLIGLVRLSDYAKTNRTLSQQNHELLKAASANGQFGIQAVQCVLDQFALHRITNQEVHDHMAAALHVSSTPLSPLPPMPTDAQVDADCAPFYRR